MTVDMMKTLLLQAVTIMQLEAKFVFCQDHNTFQILVMPNPSLDINADCGYMNTIILFFMEVIQLLVAETNNTINI
jgi:hypothetical protein